MTAENAQERVDESGPGLPLAGVRVIELGTMVAGPFAGTLLGDFGADVVKIETAAGDTMRQVEPIVEGQSLYWAVDARNKRGVTCDLRDDDDRAALLRLAADAQILVENFRPGTLEKWGIGPDVLWSVNPDLVVVRVSGFGQTGSRAQLPAYDRVVQAMSGYSASTGEPGTPPLAVGNFVSDYTSGLFAAFGAMVALHAVGRGLGGQVVDVASLECLVRLSEVDLALHDRTGGVRPRLGSGHLAAAPMNAYRTSDDEWVMIHVPTDRMFAKLADAVGDPALADERFGTNPSRVANREALDLVLARWFAARTTERALAELGAADVPAARMGTAGDLADDEDLLARGAIVRAESPVGPLLMPGVVPRLTATPGRVRTPANPVPGQSIQDLVGEA